MEAERLVRRLCAVQGRDEVPWARDTEREMHLRPNCQRLEVGDKGRGEVKGDKSFCVSSSLPSTEMGKSGKGEESQGLCFGYASLHKNIRHPRGAVTHLDRINESGAQPGGQSCTYKFVCHRQRGRESRETGLKSHRVRSSWARDDDAK